MGYGYNARRFGFVARRGKFGNRSQVCLAKHLHQSMLEADYCNELFARKSTGEIKSYDIQHKIEIKVRGKQITNHYVDFLVYFKDGRKEFHEVKGYATDVWKLKKRLVEALFPKIPYVVKV